MWIGWSFKIKIWISWRCWGFGLLKDQCWVFYNIVEWWFIIGRIFRNIELNDGFSRCFLKHCFGLRLMEGFLDFFECCLGFSRMVSRNIALGFGDWWNGIQIENTLSVLIHSLFMNHFYPSSKVLQKIVRFIFYLLILGFI